MRRSAAILPALGVLAAPAAVHAEVPSDGHFYGGPENPAPSRCPKGRRRSP
jgi:hypothetical protein